MSTNDGVGETNPKPAETGRAESDRLQPILAAIESFDYATANTQLGSLATLLPVHKLIGEVVLPLMRRVGECWHNATLTVAQEHMTSAILRNLMGGLVRLQEPSRQPMRILFATPSGEQHEFGILAAAMLAGATGFEPLYLGPNLPAREIVAAAERTSPQAVVLGTYTSEPTPETTEDLKLVASQLPKRTELWLGGSAAGKALPVVRHEGVFALENFAELDAHLARLKADWGHAIGQVASLGDRNLKELSLAPPKPVRSRKPAATGRVESNGLQPIVAAIESFDYATANAQLGRLAAMLPVHDLVGKVVLPLMRLVGERWHDGTLTIAQEHMTSAILRNLMGGLVRLYAPPTQPVRILFATPSGDLHEFGILAAAMLAGATGFEPLYLGPNLPAQEIVAVAERTSPKGVVLGINTSEPTAKIMEDLRLVASQLPKSAELWLGGIGARKALPAVRCARAFVLENFDELDGHLARLKGEELQLRDRAMAAAAEGIVISDANQPGNPLIYVNDGFARLTGYSRGEALGRNCHFLQGQDTDPAAIEQVRVSLRERRDCLVELLNYRKDGTPFWNRLSITPLQDVQGRLTHFVGVQSDITARKLAEERLATANAEILASNNRMKRELEAAARVQQALLPTLLPRLEGVEFAWLFKPSAELAGDQLNVMQLDDARVALYLLDVSGHGVASSLMAVAANLLLSRRLDSPSPESSKFPEGPVPTVISPADTALLLNQQFPREKTAGQYLTLVYGVLNVKSGEFQYVAAGHPGPVVVRRDAPAIALEEATGLPIGLFPTSFEERTVQLGPGDRIYLYSDGITEAMNSAGDEFGIQRLLSQLGELKSLPLDQSLNALTESLEEWRCHECLRDDVSMVALEWRK